MNTTTTKIAGEAMTDKQINTTALRDHAAKGFSDECLLPKASANLIADELDSLRALLASKPAVPEGWKLVPVEPTDAMIDAACPVGEAVDHFDMKTALREAIAASPTAPAQSCGDAEQADAQVDADERSSFEAAWRQEYPLHSATTFKRSGFNPDGYATTRVQDGWLIWQARAKTGHKNATPRPDAAEQADEAVTRDARDCPHAAPHRYCAHCPVSPCPIGLGDKK
jgi:hypothetical protein